MIPPLSAEPGLATSINREPDTQTQALGMPRSAPIESTRAAAPNEQPDNPNTNENTNLSQGSLRLSADAANRPGNGLLNTLEDAKAALNKVLEQFNQSPNTSMQAQRADSGAVAALMQPA
jgi:hypothetical protein